MLAIAGRNTLDVELASSARSLILDIDPIGHFVAAEFFLETEEEAAFLKTLKSEYPTEVILELAIDHARRGQREDALALLGVGAEGVPHPIRRAWAAYLGGNLHMVDSPADPTFVFPFRRETLDVLEWVTEHNGHWSWTYLLALNLWTLDREDEAASMLESMGGAPDYAPAYVSRAHLMQQLSRGNPEEDLRRAVDLDPNDRTTLIHLIRYLQNEEKWDDAVAFSSEGRELFAGDFNLDLLHVKSLNHLGRQLEAIDVLNNTHVLPSEHARESHRLYVQAHLLAALNAIDNTRYETAQQHLLLALEWPEHLGQGRPYRPDERLIEYLSGQVEARLRNHAEAAVAFENVIAATDQTDPGSSRLGLLVIPALVEVRGTMGLGDYAFDPSTDVGEFASELIGALQTAGSVQAIVERLQYEYAELFEDLEGQLLLRALLIASTQR